MKYTLDTTDTYRVEALKKILTLAPITAISAAFTFTIARLFGFFESVNLLHLICFDVVCFSYCIPAYFLRKKGIIKDGEIDNKHMDRACIILDILVLVQWNLISYVFPARSFWGYAPMFVLLTSFLFRTKTVLIEIIGMSISIAVSWLVLKDKLIPIGEVNGAENIILSVVALVVSFTVIGFLTYLAESFTTVVKKTQKDLEDKNIELEKMGVNILDFSAEIIEERDFTSGTHVKRIKDYTYILAKQVQQNCPEYELTDKKINQISLGSALHDIGKIGIPDNILLKPGRLTEQEFEVIKTHPVLGGRIIDKIPDSVGKEFKAVCKEICMFHHERYGGKGYPSGLKGDNIPVSAQIVAIVDCFDALTNDRPYKSALPKEVAINMIVNGECGEFSDKLIKCVLDCKKELFEV